MKKQKQEELLVEYILGNLDWEQSEKVELLIRTDSAVKTQWKTLQEGLEQEVEGLPQKKCEKEEIKNAIFSQLGLNQSSENQKSSHKAPKSSHSVSWISWSGWGVAAALVLIAITTYVTKRNTIQPFYPQKEIALAVFDLSYATENRNSSALIKEVIYADSRDYDSLYEAELKAEKLWSGYMKKYKNKSSLPPGNGFVVYDLKENQGFVGVYNQSQKENNNPDKNNELWLSFSSDQTPVSIGAIRKDPDNMGGVYYFSLDEPKMPRIKPESVKPVLSSHRPQGI